MVDVAGGCGPVAAVADRRGHSVGVLLLDADGRVVEVNGAARNLLGDVVGRRADGSLVGEEPGLLTADLDRVRHHRCILRRSVTRADQVPFVLTIGARVVDGAVVGFVVRVATTDGVPVARGLRALLADLAGNDPLRVILLVDRSARCVAVYGCDPDGLDLDAATLVDEHLAVAVPEPLRSPVLALHAAALAGEPSEVEVTGPVDGRRVLVTATPVRSAADFDGVVVTCRLLDPGRVSAESPTVTPRHVLRVGRLTVDLVTRQVEVAGRPGVVRLTGRECELLCDLLHHQGIPRSREDLLATVWGIPFATSTSVVDVTMHRLRLKLRIEELRTVRGSGLVFSG